MQERRREERRALIEVSNVNRQEYARCEECGHGFTRDAEWKRLCWDCWRERKDRKRPTLSAVTASAVDSLPDTAMLRRPLQLCLPDKDAGSESAHVATRWLLDLRERMKNIAEAS